MKDDQLLTISIALLFVLLWLPTGQHDFLIDHWMKIGTYAVPFMGIGLFAFRQKTKDTPLDTDFRFLAVLLLVAYIVHQYEEHWIDVYGNYYAFYTFNNNFILENLGQPESTVKPLTKASVFMINTSLVWLVGLLAILRSPKHLFPLLAMASIIVVNAVVHILAGVVNFQYNPGLLTSVIIFVPIYLWMIKKVKRHHKRSKSLIIGGLVWAFLAHVLMVGGLLVANWFMIIPELVYWILLVIWSVLPVLLYRP
ncbi:MAG: HXXEE domain-containing protein [Bacteroidota bacterium]